MVAIVAFADKLILEKPQGGMVVKLSRHYELAELWSMLTSYGWRPTCLSISNGVALATYV